VHCLLRGAMLQEELEIAIKVVVVGNGAVGKSSLIQRYCKGVFTKDYKKTIGVDFLERQLKINEEDIRLMLWDTAGQEEFGAITRSYYRGAQACVLAFSTTDRDSFEAIEEWRKKLDDEVPSDIPLVLIQNKIDLLDQAVVQQEEADDLAKKLKVRFYRTSVKEDLNVNEVFKYLAEKHLEKLRKDQETEQEKPQNIKQIGLFATNGDSTATAGGDSFSLQPSKTRTNTQKKHSLVKNASSFNVEHSPTNTHTHIMRLYHRARVFFNQVLSLHCTPYVIIVLFLMLFHIFHNFACIVVFSILRQLTCNNSIV